MKYISISDIHLGHRRTPTNYIVKNLKKYVFNEENKDVDVIFFGGDIYDRLLDVSSQDNLDIISFFGFLLDYCYDNDIAIRLLEGTPGHEWGQLKVIVRLNELRDNPVDLKHFDILDIDYMEKFDKYVLYIPDEWSHDHDEIERQIEEKMNERGIHQVDICILHSVFKYQMLGIPYHGFYYKESYFLNITKSLIHIGHFHIHSDFDRIIAGGSFDRLSHGEEGKKGFVRVDGNDWKFIPNKDAYIYKTIRVTKNDTLNSLDKKVLKYPIGSYIRLQLSKDHPFNINYKDLTIRYRDYHLSKKVAGDTESDSITNIINDDSFHLDSFDFINSDIRETVKTSLLSKHQLSEREIVKLDDFLNVFKNLETSEEKE